MPTTRTQCRLQISLKNVNDLISEQKLNELRIASESMTERETRNDADAEVLRRQPGADGMGERGGRQDNFNRLGRPPHPGRNLDCSTKELKSELDARQDSFQRFVSVGKELVAGNLQPAS